MSSTVLRSFSGALQASLSVLLVIFFGVIASQFDLIDNASAKKVSRVSVKMFLPLLLITKVGDQLSLSNVKSYGPVLLWSVTYNLLSMVIGLLGVRFLGLPEWVTPAITFNNTTSLPLLLVQSLEKTGLLKALVGSGNMKDAIDRAQSYFLVCAVVSNCLTFALGPKLLGGGQQQRTTKQNGRIEGSDAAQTANETTSLLPDRLHELESQAFLSAHNTTFDFLQQYHMTSEHLSPRTKAVLSILVSFINAPLIGALIGVVIGLTPALHRAFFADTPDGGIFTAWLTTSLKNTGELFVSLQVILVGVKLSSSLRKMKRGDDNSGHLPLSAAVFVFGIRYVFWPLVSISAIYGMIKAGWLGQNDGILWFSMMLMPTGPPAMSLIPMADVSDTQESITMTIAKLLTAMYALSPVLACVVVAALKTSQVALSA